MRKHRLSVFALVAAKATPDTPEVHAAVPDASEAATDVPNAYARSGILAVVKGDQIVLGK